jgi:hypothetical protein
MPKVKAHYKTDHRIKLVQVTVGKVNFLVHLRIFEQTLPDVDHWEIPEADTGMEVSAYQTLYKERLQ